MVCMIISLQSLHNRRYSTPRGETALVEMGLLIFVPYSVNWSVFEISTVWCIWLQSSAYEWCTWTCPYNLCTMVFGTLSVFYRSCFILSCGREHGTLSFFKCTLECFLRLLFVEHSLPHVLHFRFSLEGLFWLPVILVHTFIFKCLLRPCSGREWTRGWSWFMVLVGCYWRHLIWFDPIDSPLIFPLINQTLFL